MTERLILDLCGGTGAWSKPYREAGYTVRSVDLPEDVRLVEQPKEPVHGILAAPPCTVFSYARNRLAYPDLLEEDLQPHKVQEMMFWSSENVNYRSDITDTYDLKIAALHCHQSQLQGFDVPRLEDMLNQRCIDMAKGEDFQLAEGFHRVEILW